MKAKRLSKSRVVLGLQCPKALYLSAHHPELADEVSDSQQIIFDQGHTVGMLARTHFKNGVLIDAPHSDSESALKQTESAIASGALNIFEATFTFEDVLVKVDILNRESPAQPWQIVEVKSTTQVKDVHIPDAAIQLWVCKGAGLSVRSVSMMTINNQCTFPDLSNLFSLTDVTEVVSHFAESIPATLKKLKDSLELPKVPPIEIGKQCEDPYPCGFKSHCWSALNIPEISVFNIPRLSEDKKWELYRNRKVELKHLDAGDFNPSQARMIEYTKANRRFIDSKAISSALRKWTFPLSYLDFETIGYAIPRYDGQRPYQQLPFQFSCHFKRERSARLEHADYLHITDTDPRESVSIALTKLIPKSGSVVAYNMAFEKGVLQSLAKLFPIFEKQLQDIANRLVDPLPIFRAHVYDPGFAGSFSIKDVAPAILGKSSGYDGMAVGDGVEAQTAYLEMINPATSSTDKDRLRQGLAEYCAKDTKVLSDLVDWLYGVADSAPDSRTTG